MKRNYGCRLQPDDFNRKDTNMCECNTVVLNTLADARREIFAALSLGEVTRALGSIQCLWIFCGNAGELHALLDEVLVLAGRFRKRLTPEGSWQLAEGISQAKLDYLENLGADARKEYLLAGTVA